MHPYCTNSPANPKLIAYLAIAATGLSTALSYLLAQLHGFLGWTVGGVSAMTFFGVLYFVFDRFLWKWTLARSVLLVPDLNGTWDCQGTTILKNGSEQPIPWSGTIEIRQSWSRIAIALSTAQSKSRSIAASLYREPGSGFRLMYHYDNRPGAGELNLRRHSGQCDLLFDEAAGSAEGSYFTDQDRLTVGTMHLSRKATHAQTGTT